MKTVLLLSGGLDSAVLLYHLKAAGHEVCCLSVDYGQRHSRELAAAARVAESAGAPLEVVRLPGLRQVFGAGNSQTGTVPVPHGHYEAESMRLTVVPNRNMVLLALAAARAVAIDASAVAYAAHAGDRAVYPDCRPEFVEAMRRPLGLCDYRPLSLLAPFLATNKAGIVELGSMLKVPFGLTWTCYQGGESHCGRCGADVERRGAFAAAGVSDPTEYEG